MGGRVLRCMGAAAIAAAFAVSARAADGPRHVPSPDWRDQIIYFVMVDRFDDGDPANNDQGAGEYDPGDRRRYSGGDLRGVARRLDYIQGLGATAVWITPPVANQWWNARVGYGGYHGYWAEDFTAVDAHAGTLADYRALSGALHGRGMYLVQDVVVNHVGDWFRYPDGPHGGDPAPGVRIVPDSRGRTGPSQPPFDLNDPRRSRDRAAGIYHWTPDVRDYTDPVQEKTWQMSGLDDLDTGNPAVRRALRASYGHWIREVGVDAFRVDTAFYVPPAYFDDFLNARDAKAPGVLEVARSTGRDAFHVFGEGFAVDRPYEDVQSRRIEAYARDAQGQPLLPSMINFPLQGTLLDVLARGRPTAELGDRIERMMRVHERPHLMPTFLDNHDVDRFLASGTEAGLRQGLLMLMTLPGIPTIYYGTEQGYTQVRAAMFAGGWGSGGRDRFDTTAPGYRYLQGAAALRRGDRLFSRGMPRVLASSPAGPGLLAYRVEHEGRAAIVAINTSSSPVLADALDTGAAAGARLRPAFAIDGEAPVLRADSRGRVQLVLPPRAGYVWHVDAGDGSGASSEEDGAPTLDAMPSRIDGDLRVSGRARPGARLQLVVDGDLGRAAEAAADRSGRWQARLRTDDFLDAGVSHRVVAFDPSRGIASEARTFTVERTWNRVATHVDPRGDDTGPTGAYLYPMDESWGANRQLDIERVDVDTSDGALRIDLTMRSITRTWNPANGFDHVAFTVYLELPDAGAGARVMPLQQAELPDGMRWHRRLRAGGWATLLSSHEAAAADAEGAPVSPGAQVQVDADARRVRLIFPAAALGRTRSLSGARLLVTTWDYDAGYRAIAPQAGSHTFGGASSDAPRIMDAVLTRIP